MIENIDWNYWFSRVDHTLIGMLFGLVIAVMIVMLFHTVEKFTASWRGAKKMRREEEERVKRAIATILVDGFDEACLKDPTDPEFIDRKVGWEWLRRFGHVLSIKDIVPKNEVMMKERLQAKHLPPEIAATAPKNLSSGSAEEEFLATKNSIVELLESIKAPKKAA